MPLPGESRAITGALPIARSTLNKQIHPENTLRLPKTALRGEPLTSEHIPGGKTCSKFTIPATTSTGPRRSHQHSGHFPTSSSWRSACAGQGGSPTWTGNRPPAGSSGRESRSGAPSEGDQKSKAQGAEHPCSRAPVFGVAGGLNPAARVTAEAEMEGPSPPLSTSDSGHPQMQKSRKKIGATKDTWSDSAGPSMGQKGVSGTDTGKNGSGNESGNRPRKMGYSCLKRRKFRCTASSGTWV